MKKLQLPVLLIGAFMLMLSSCDLFNEDINPDETIAASFATGSVSYPPTGYGSGLLIAMYKVGEGRMILNTPYILENLDLHPAADKLMLNLIRYAQEQIILKKP